MSTAILEAPPAVRESFEVEEFESELECPEGFEFVGGELRERNVSNHAALVTAEIAGALRDHIKPRQSGWIFSETASYRCFKDNALKQRRADTAFYRLERLTSEQALARGPFEIAPDIVVEVISPNDNNYEVNEKRNEWLRAGVRQVWVVYPVEREVHVFWPNGASILRAEDMLTAEPILPGFSVSVGELFKLPGEGA